MSNLLLDAKLNQASYDNAYHNKGTGDRISGWRPVEVVIDPSKQLTTNFSAQLFKGADGTYKLAYRGTANPVGEADTKMNAYLAGGGWAPEMTDAIRFTQQAIRTIMTETGKGYDYARSLLSVTGHSQGGFEAELSAKFFGLKGTSLDGPGAADHVGGLAWSALKAELMRQQLELQADYAVTDFLARRYTILVGGVGFHASGVTVDNAALSLWLQGGAMLTGPLGLAISLGVQAGGLHMLKSIIDLETARLKSPLLRHISEVDDPLAPVSAQPGSVAASIAGEMNAVIVAGEVPPLGSIEFDARITQIEVFLQEHPGDVQYRVDNGTTLIEAGNGDALLLRLDGSGAIWSQDGLGGFTQVNLGANGIVLEAITASPISDGEALVTVTRDGQTSSTVSLANHGTTLDILERDADGNLVVNSHLHELGTAANGQPRYGLDQTRYANSQAQSTTISTLNAAGQLEMTVERSIDGHQVKVEFVEDEWGTLQASRVIAVDGQNATSNAFAQLLDSQGYDAWAFADGYSVQPGASSLEALGLARVNDDAAFAAWGGLDPWDAGSIFGLDGGGNPTVNTPSQPITDVGQLFDAEERMLREFNAGWITQEQYWAFQDYTLDFSLNGIIGSILPPTLPNPFDFWFDPIGAFYDSQSSVYDNAASIAAHTPVVLDAANLPLNAAQLAAWDTNGDGQIGTGETASLKFWRDLNENGQADSGELIALDRDLKQADYGFYTEGNGRIGTAAPTEIAAPAAPAQPGKTNLIQAVPDSNYRTLRDTDNRWFYVPPGYLAAYFDWSASEVKINYNNKTYLIGTDSANNFDSTWFDSDPSYFGLNSSLLVNFLAGDGDDIMGGSSRNDNLWGGSGIDTLWGYAGNDKLYGELGADDLIGEDGDDYLDGGADNDRLFGDVGNDTLHGGDGNDILLGFTPSNDPKQSLNAGETDNDFLYGGAGDDDLYGGLGNDYLDGGANDDFLRGDVGDDTLFGGDGLDELQGNEGNDKLLGEADNDKLFGQVGNDTLWGGDGNDILVGFTASNEAKQSLSAGETDVDLLYGEGGNDNLFGDFGNDILDGGIGADMLSGGSGDDQLFGGGDNDELSGNDGQDQLLGGAGDDNLFGQVGNDTLWGGDGNDYLQGFTASNEAKQSLSAGETDDDILVGGAGSDALLGGVGQDTLHGGTGRDELQGGIGDDALYGEEDNDNLFGQVGNDVLYGGDGDDYLQGFTASNETKQTLNPGETDNDHLYGGAGADTLAGDLGDDYLDGGAGADTMIGGQGNDTYIVNSVNDVIYEQAGQGYDTVITNTNYLLNANVEELRLLEGFAVHGTGNASDNLIIGNSSDNILDGVTGADTMIGGGGNDTYYVDNLGDVVTENANEGTDTVQSSIDYLLGANEENLLLLDFSKPEKGLVDGQQVLVYGYPKRNELDYMQGDAVANYLGTCALTSIANLLTQAGRPTSESQVVNLAINNGWTISNPDLPAYQLGGSNVTDQQNILNSYQIRNDVIFGYNETGLANLVRSGRGVIVAVNAGDLWGESAYLGTGQVNHAITLTGAVYNATDGSLAGFYVADSGRGQVSDMTRFVGIDAFRLAADVLNAYTIYTIEPLKFWDEDIDGYGNELDNTLIGNRGDNLLMGDAGNDVLEGDAGADQLDGGSGIDTMTGGTGNDTYVVDNSADVVTELANEGTDTVESSVTRTLDANVEHLTLTGTAAINGTGNELANTLRGNSAVNTLSGLDGDDTLYAGDGDTVQGGLGNDALIAETTVGNWAYLWGDEGDDTLTGGAGSATLYGGAGNDTITGGAGDNYIFGDDFTGGVGNDVIHGGEGYDFVIAGGGTDLVYGNSGDDLLAGGDGDDTLDGGAGDDQLIGQAGNDTMVGGLGDDTYVVDSASDTVTENLDEGTDTVSSTVTRTLDANVENLSLTGSLAINGTGNELANTLTGNSADNNLNGGAGTDTLIGGGGNDLLDGGTGTDDLSGGAGNDTYMLDDVYDLVTENVGEGTDTVLVNAGYHWLTDNVENLTLGTTAFLGGGNDLGNVLTGNDLNNPLFGEGGNDTLIGGGGSDWLYGGTGADAMSGGSGNDTYFVDDAGDSVSELLNEGTDTVNSSVAWTLGLNLENLTLTGNATITGTGNSLDNTLMGNTANNTLTGGAGDDILKGSSTPAPTSTAVGSLVVYAKGTPVEGIYPTMQIYVDGVLIQSFTVDATSYTAYTLDPALLGMNAGKIDVVFNNDAYRADLGQDRNLYVQKILVNGQTLNATDNGVFYDPGTGVAAFDGINLRLGSEGLGSNGALRFTLTDNDTLDGGTGADQMAGGIGNDTYVVDSASDTVTEALNEGIDTVRSGVTRTLDANVENLVLTGTTSISGTGNALNNLLMGNNANNTLAGGDGADTLLGYNGNDRLDGGAGNDILQGGQGSDIYVVDSSGDSIWEGVNEGWDTVETALSHTLGSNIENLTLTGTAAVNGTGNSLGNTLIGNAAANTLQGGAGYDTLDGGSGADRMEGGTEDDGYYVDNAGDQVVENAGEGDWDWIETTLNDYVLVGNVEALGLAWGAGNLNGIGNTANNYLYGNEGNNVLTGLGGNDELYGLDGQDTLIGGVGDDFYHVFSDDGSIDSVIENANEGVDTVYFYGAAEGTTYTLAANVEDATTEWGYGLNLTGNGLNNILTGDSGINVLDGGVGADTLDGGYGNDIYVVDDAGDVVTEMNIVDMDTVQSSVSWTLGAYVENLTLTGSDYIEGTGNDLANVLEGNGNGNTLSGLAGNDTLKGGAGYDYLDGGTGADRMEGGTEDDGYFVDNAGDRVVENAGEGDWDWIETTLDNYVLVDNVEALGLAWGAGNLNAIGNAANNYLYGNDGNNLLTGLDGNDELDGSTGADTLIGGWGDDTYVVDNTSDVVTENAGEGTDKVIVQTLTTYTLGSTIENGERWSAGTLNGNALNNVLIGSYANDALGGGAGDDTVNGGYGNDWIVGGAGADHLDGSSGNDWAAYSGSSQAVNINLGLNTAHGGEAEGDTFSGIEMLFGSRLDDTLIGDAANNQLQGSAGNDLLDGGAGADTAAYYSDTSGVLVDLVAGTATDGYGGTDTLLNIENAGGSNVGNDVLYGNAAGNSLSGGGGNDALYGRGGNDWIDGGAGNDTYHFNRGDGADSWYDNDATVGNTDVARFAADIANDQIWFRKVGNDLEASVIGTSDKAVVKNWYLNGSYHLERFEAGNGKVLLDSQVQALVDAMAAFTPPAAGQTTLPSTYQDSLAPVLAANWQ